MIFKDGELFEMLKSIDKKLDIIISMKKAEKIKKANERRD